MPDSNKLNSKFRPRVVVMGAGFGGLYAARALARHQIDVILIDQENYHTFTPLLYQVAAAEIEPEEIAFPIRSIFRKKRNVNFLLGEVSDIDIDRQIVTADNIKIPYDYLILAAGSVSHFFGIPGVEEHSFPLKNMSQAITLRNHIVSCFERAIYETDNETHQSLLTFAIVGGGPTGVEFAGALIELINGPLKRDFSQLDMHEARVILIEAASALLTNLPGKLRAYSLRRLRGMGVEIQLQSSVSAVEKGILHFKDGRFLKTDTIIWTAGVMGNPLARYWGLPIEKNNTVTVEQTLQVSNYPNIYVVGDLARSQSDGKLLPMLAPVAMQEGKLAANNIVRQIAGKTIKQFHYKDKGTLATIGRNKAVAQLGRWTFTGYPAWILWVVVHLAELIGFRNRILVLINWFWDYLFFERAVRLILPRESHRQKVPLSQMVPHPETVSKSST